MLVEETDQKCDAVNVIHERISGWLEYHSVVGMQLPSFAVSC